MSELRRWWLRGAYGAWTVMAPVPDAPLEPPETLEAVEAVVLRRMEARAKASEDLLVVVERERDAAEAENERLREAVAKLDHLLAAPGSMTWREVQDERRAIRAALPGKEER